jgi:hypothetical protein
MVMRPDTAREQFRELVGSHRILVLLERLLDRCRSSWISSAASATKVPPLIA